MYKDIRRNQDNHGVLDLYTPEHAYMNLQNACCLTTKGLCLFYVRPS